VDQDSQESRKALGLLRTVRGQVEAVVRMVEEERYCIDVSRQVLASIALLRKANLLILRRHMNTCVKEAVASDRGAEKIDEITMILEKYLER
jgi:DNA-binding FrmR family transcriptional regulator